MKTLTEMFLESLNECGENPGGGIYKKETEEEECERCKAIYMGHETEEEEKESAEESIKSEGDFRDYAKNKFKVVFGDKLDKDKMNKTIDGILKDNKTTMEIGDWGTLIGILNKSFGA